MFVLLLFVVKALAAIIDSFWRPQNAPHGEERYCVSEQLIRMLLLQRFDISTTLSEYSRFCRPATRHSFCILLAFRLTSGNRLSVLFVAMRSLWCLLGRACYIKVKYIDITCAQLCIILCTWVLFEVRYVESYATGSVDTWEYDTNGSCVPVLPTLSCVCVRVCTSNCVRGRGCDFAREYVCFRSTLFPPIVLCVRGDADTAFCSNPFRLHVLVWLRRGLC